MNDQEQLERSLQRVFAPHKPSEDLKQRVRSLRPRTSRKPLWLACGFAGFAGATALGILLILPATSLAKAVIKQASAFEGHLLTYIVLPNGRWQADGEQWIRGGRLRSVDHGDHPYEFLHDPDLGFNIALNAGEGTIEVRDLKKNPPPSRLMPVTLTPQNLKDFLSSYGIHETPHLERTKFNGQTADCVSLSMGPNIEDKLYADPTTHRILGWSYQNKKVWPNNPPENNYIHVCVVDPKPLPPHIFDPVFDINGVPTDVLADRAKWQDRLSKPLSIFTFNLVPRPYLPSMKTGSRRRSVAVRSVTVNPAGDVFVLFTGVHGDYGTNVVPSSIHDSTGGRYVKGISFLPSDSGNRRMENFIFDGSPLEGAWFIRIGGGALEGPITVGFKQEFEAASNLAFSYTAEPERIGHEIPSFMPYMYLPIGTHKKWLAMHTMELADDRSRAKDYGGEEKLIRQVIALDCQFYMPADLDCRLGTSLEKRGKRAAALASYEEARRALAMSKFDPGPWLKNQIDAAFTRLKGQSSRAAKIE
ncbi:MAG: hypothetical protein P4L46_02720 [Fimbriimonas sp.]|nr:hypothetical protein [Fimbriimonas sp.]